MLCMLPRSGYSQPHQMMVPISASVASATTASSSRCTFGGLQRGSRSTRTIAPWRKAAGVGGEGVGGLEGKESVFQRTVGGLRAQRQRRHGDARPPARLRGGCLLLLGNGQVIGRCG